MLDWGNSRLKSVMVTDMLGKIVFTTFAWGEQVPVTISHLTNGVYRVRVSSGNLIKYLRLVNNEGWLIPSLGHIQLTVNFSQI